MSTKNTNKQAPIAVAKLPKQPSPLATRATSIADAVDTDKVHFPTEVPAVATTRADATLLQEKVKVAKTRAVGSVEARDLQARAVRRDVGQLVNAVQLVADTLPHDAAATFITAMMLFVSAVGARPATPELGVKQLPVSGDVRLMALSLGRGTTYYFQVSLDQKNWTSQPDSHVCKITVTGLTPGQVYYFRFRALVGKTLRDYSQVVSFMVK